MRIPIFQQLKGDYSAPEYVVGYYGTDKIEFLETCMKSYQRFLTSGIQPFDPLELARDTAEITTREGPEGLERKYAGIYTRAAAMTDPSVMPQDERRILMSMLDEIDPSADYSATMEEEQIDEYDTTMRRLKAFAEPQFAEKLERQIMDEATERFGNEG